MGYVLFALVWVINFGISIWNAYSVGKVWVDAKHEGGWHRFMCWMGAIMSACGFTWCYLSFLTSRPIISKWITDDQTTVALDLGYILLLPFMLFAGYAITLDSWVQAYRTRWFPQLRSRGVEHLCQHSQHLFGLAQVNECVPSRVSETSLAAGIAPQH